MADENLIRGIGRWDLVAIVINSIIGAGIFLLPSKVSLLVGGYSIAVIVVCAVIIGLIILCFTEVSSRFSGTGGPYLYAREAFGPLIAFEVGWLSILVRTASYAAILDIFVSYFSFFWPAASELTFRAVVIGTVVFTIAAINIVGVRQTAIMTDLFTIGKIVPLLVFAAVGLFFLRPENYRFDVLPDRSSFSAAILTFSFAFFGFEMGLVPAGEVKGPQKNFPFALLVALGSVALLYILIQIVSIGTLPDLATSEKPLADAANNLMGPSGAALISAGALISILGNLNVGLLAGSRFLFAMGERREIPVIFSKTHARFKTPYIAVVFTALMIFLFTIQFSFLTVLLTAVVSRLLVYATICLSLIVFRRRADMPRARFSIPFGTANAILSLVLIGWLMTTIDFAKEGLPIICTLAAGLLYYYGNRIYRMRTPP